VIAKYGPCENLPVVDCAEIAVIAGLLAYDVWTEISVRAVTVSLVVKFFRQIKSYGDRNAVKLSS
jgi:hypothetical protein